MSKAVAAQIGNVPHRVTSLNAWSAAECTVLEGRRTFGSGLAEQPSIVGQASSLGLTFSVFRVDHLRHCHCKCPWHRPAPSTDFPAMLNFISWTRNQKKSSLSCSHRVSCHNDKKSYLLGLPLKPRGQSVLKINEWNQREFWSNKTGPMDVGQRTPRAPSKATLCSVPSYKDLEEDVTTWGRFSSWKKNV